MLDQTERFPCDDGLPMTDKDINRLLMEATEWSLKEHFRDDDMRYVSCNLFVYYNPDDDRDRCSPDVFVVRGVPNHLRESYKVWQEGPMPQVAFEFTTRWSRRRDIKAKRELYERLGVEEYYVFDPTGQLLNPPFVCFRRQHDRLVQLPHCDGIFSPELGVEIRIEGQLLRIYRPGTDVPMPFPDEMQTMLREALEELESLRGSAQRETERATQEARRADEEARRADDEARRADDEARRADDEASRAQAEAERARQAEAREAALRAELERLRKSL